MNSHTARAPHALAAILGLLVLAGCGDHGASGDADDQPATAKPAAQPPSGAGFTLTKDQIATLGIATGPAQPFTYAPATEGYGVVLSHELIAQLTADLATAEAAARQSRAVLARAQHLAGTPGAFSAENQESAQRQASSDAAALTLARSKLTATLGRQAPGRSGDDALLGELASGQAKLVRVTFPLGVLETAPKSLHLARLDASAPGKGWTTSTLWSAPADAAIPGRSFFALLRGSDAAEGERLRAWAASGAGESGVLVPTAAVVISEGKYWCYVEEPPGTFARRPVDTSRPVADGYFVQEGVTSGEPIVTAAAGLLLARETNPATDAD